MGKKGRDGGKEKAEKEGTNLLGRPTFEELGNGRLKCSETGHELPAHTRESYERSKHCRLGLIDAALSTNKPPLNMFQQHPKSRSNLICKLTGATINKSEEHIWKHINGKQFLKMLEEKEAKREITNKDLGHQSDHTLDETLKCKRDGLKKKKNKQKADASKVSSDKESDAEMTDFWIPPVGERWDHDDRGDRWNSGSESAPEIDDTEREDGRIEVDITDAGELDKQTKRMPIELEASRSKKKRKTNST